MFILWRAGLRLRVAIRKAEHEHARTKHRYYVMPDSQDRLVVMRRRGMRLLRRHGIFQREVRMSDLQRESFYFTADRGGHAMSEGVAAAKRTMYLRYVMRRR